MTARRVHSHGAGRADRAPEAIRLTIKRVRAVERPVRLRLPFRFGDALVTETAEAYAEVTAEGPNGRVTGVAAQLMVPRWFDKRPGLTNADTVEALRDSVRAAASAAPGLSGSVAALTAELRAAGLAALSEMPRLAAGFGPALLEAALIDAVCRAANLPFHAAASSDLFGMAALAPPDLPAEALSPALAALEPRWEMAVRHTVGYDAPLTEAEIGPDAQRDGRPVSLSAVIAATGCRWFKIKLKGDPAADLARLAAVAAVLDAEAGDYRATLDANEQYAPDPLAAFLSAFSADPRLEAFRRRVLFLEQPFPREIALETPPPAGLPCVIDESDDADDAFPRAARLGWAGVSAKSCKGVLRALLNTARVARLRANGRDAILTAEDLTCQPGLCLQQDTLMAALTGAAHAERNGWHFAGGMQGASEAERGRFLAAHPDLYDIVDGGVRLRIEDGRLRFTSLDAPGFGSAAQVDLSRDTLIAEQGT